MVRLIETKGRMVSARGRGEEGMSNWCLMGTEFLFGKIKKFCRWSDSCTTMLMYLMPLNHTLKKWLRRYILL